ncbi:hypothetical protein [Actinomadura rubrisoli]|uniref:Uncharacterized protein n=1 Tax=Actinomadura rubrisoli TaxID=2530368 RepID=A0A4R5BH69_9ACTN|nr:hypothetical protein [Actinomadura rubrisoli]TDD83032.1 hypothetical protein E1298_21850 [Actinomadura rubrisoli]
MFALVAVVGMAVMLALFWDDSEAASGPSEVGDARSGVSVELTEGRGYFLYVRDGASTPRSCTVRVGDASGPVRLTTKNSWAESDHQSYRYVGSFEAPVSGQAKLTCGGVSGPLLVTPDDTIHAYLGLSVLVAVLLGVLAILAFVFLLVRRGNARRASASASVPGPYPY